MFKNYFHWKKGRQKKDREKVMIEKVISNDYDISDINLWFMFFANMFPNFKIMASANCETTIEHKTENPIQNAINKFLKIILVYKC